MRTKEHIRIPEPRVSTENLSEPAEPATGRGRGGWVRGTLVVVLVLLLAVGTGLFVRAAQLRSVPAADNKALTDTEATTRVIGDVSNAISKVFSYSPKNTQVTRDDAKELLSGEAADQYKALYGQVEERVEKQKLTLTTHVVRVGVTSLKGDTAQLLVFLDQITERKGKKPTSAAAQLSVTAELRDGNWLITEMQAR